MKSSISLKFPILPYRFHYLRAIALSIQITLIFADLQELALTNQLFIVWKVEN